MRHIVVHLIRGEAQTAHENITKDLAEKFDSFPIHDRIQPHLTLKRWFELELADMEVLHKTLDAYAESHTQSDYELKGFDHYRADVIFVDAIPSQETLANVRDLHVALRTVPNLTFDEFDGIEDDLHATVAFGALKAFDYEKVWNYLQEQPQPHFNLKFDNVALMRRETDKWEIVKVWELNP